ncbi:lysine exporter LysO family protein [Pseudomonas asuensis]
MSGERQKLVQSATRLISPLVTALLFAIGCEFGAVLTSPQLAGHSLISGATFAVCCTLTSWILIRCFYRRATDVTHPKSENRSHALCSSLKGCALTLLIVAAGAVTSLTPLALIKEHLWLPDISHLIYALVFLVGIDLSRMKIDRQWLSKGALGLPILAITGTFAGGMMAAFLLGEPLRMGFILASGFGWMSLSSAMVGNALGSQYGVMVLVADLLREILAIMLLYTLGRVAPQACIGATGATAMDATLPIVKLTCPENTIHYAIISGFVLSVLSPVLMLFIAA